VFYFLVWLQRHYPIVPRLTLVPKKEGAEVEGQAAEAIS
jgi:hypothetical protein